MLRTLCIPYFLYWLIEEVFRDMWFELELIPNLVLFEHSLMTIHNIVLIFSSYTVSWFLVSYSYSVVLLRVMNLFSCVTVRCIQVTGLTAGLWSKLKSDLTEDGRNFGMSWNLFNFIRFINSASVYRKIKRSRRIQTATADLLYYKNIVTVGLKPW
jgi:hypothetical protein